jgi:hypothetical protein
MKNTTKLIGILLFSTSSFFAQTFKTIENQTITGTGNIDLTKTDVGLNQVDNTPDWNKPISIATQAALNGKQNTLTNPITGTGASGYMLKYIGTTAVGNSQIFDTGTNVGIGTTTPTEALHIRFGQVPKIKIESTYGPSWNIGFQTPTRFGFLSSSSVGFILDTGARDFFMIANNKANVQIRATNDNLLFFNEATGRTIIGTTTDNGQDMLQVNGSVVATKIKKSGALPGQFLMADGSTTTAVATSSIYTADGTLAGPRTITMGTNPLSFNGTGNFMINAGNVGIGTANPTAKLEVIGTVAATTFSGSGALLTGTATGLSIGGSSSSTESIKYNDGPRNLSDRLPNTFTRSVRYDFVNANITASSGYYAGVMTYNNWDGTTASTGDSSYQLAYVNESGINGTGIPGLKLRKGIDTTWGNWYSVITNNATTTTANYIPRFSGTNGIINSSIYDNGNVGIGTTNPDQKLTVKGKIHTEEVIVDLNVPADYVFQKYYTGKSELKADYELPTLAEVENFTKKNNHLPSVPSAREIKEKGLQLGEMSNVLLQKIEELTIYVIEQDKKNIEQQKEIEMLKKAIGR